MTTRHALITGGAGFIGSHVADALVARGYRVTVFDTLVDQVHGQADKDSDGWPVYLDPQIERVRGTLADPDQVKAALAGITHLVHLAASVGVGQSMTNIVDYTRNNTLGAATLLQTLRDGGHVVERIAVASSMAIYGEGACRNPTTGAMVSPPPRAVEQLRSKRWEYEEDGIVLEPVPTPESKPLAPGTIYAVNKRDHEEMFLIVGRALGIPTAALRLFNVYGSRQALSNPYAGFAAIVISRLLNGAQPMVFEDGGQRRDFVHVADVAQAFATVLDDDQPVADAFNVGSGAWVTIGEVATTIAKLLGSPIEAKVLQRARIGDVRHCFADTSRFAQRFGFRAERDFEQGMAELIEWVRRSRMPEDRFEDTLTLLEKNGLIV